MKKPISIKLDEKLWVYVKDKPNISRYIQGLIKEDLQGQQTKPIVEAVMKELLTSETFMNELQSRMGNSMTKSIPVISETGNMGLERGCCLSGKCQHWVWSMEQGANINSLSGRIKAMVE